MTQFLERDESDDESRENQDRNVPSTDEEYVDDVLSAAAAGGLHIAIKDVHEWISYFGNGDLKVTAALCDLESRYTDLIRRIETGEWREPDAWE